MFTSTLGNHSLIAQSFRIEERLQVIYELGWVLNTNRAIFILTTNNISSLDKGLKDRYVLVEMNAAKESQYLSISRKVTADMNVVLNDMELTAEIAAANGSMRQVMSRVKRLARRKQSARPA